MVYIKRRATGGRFGESRLYAGKDSVECQAVDTLKEASHHILASRVVFLDDGHLFEDIGEYVPLWANMGKIIFVTICPSTPELGVVPGIPPLLAVADRLETRMAVCSAGSCQMDAPFTAPGSGGPPRDREKSIWGTRAHV